VIFFRNYQENPHLLWNSNASH